jgi:hypothetical protein
VAQGATVSLLPGSSSSSASRPASPAPRQTEGSISSADEEPTPRPAPAPAPAKRRRFSDPDAGVYFAGSLGSDVRLFNASPVAFGAPLQMGIGFNFLRMRLALLGEGQIGIGGGTQDGNVYLFFELSAGGAAELYFPGRVIGVGAAWNLFRDKNLGDIPIAGRDDTKTSYQRLGLIFQGPGSLKTTLYALRFNDDSWGFGVQIGGAWGLER